MERKIYHYIAVLISPVGNIAVYYYFSRIFSLDEFGKFSILISILMILNAFIMCGQGSAISMVFFSDERRGDRNINQELKNSLHIITVSALIFGVLIFALWNKYFSSFFQINIVLLSILSTYLVCIQNILSSVINCKDEYRKNLIIYVMSAFVMLIVIFLYPTIEGYLVSLSVSSVLTFFIFIYKNNMDTGFLEGAVSKKNLLKIGWVSIPGMLISSGSNFIDKYLLDRFISISEVAIYSISSLMAINMGRLLIMGMIKPNTTILMHHIQHREIAECKKIFNVFENQLIFIAFISLVLFYTVSEILVPLIFGEKYIKSIDILLILFGAILLEGMMQLYSHIIIQSKKLHFLVINAGLMLCVSLGLNYLFIEAFGLMGVAITFYLISLSTLIIIYFISNKTFKLIDFPTKLVLSVTTMSILSFFFPPSYL